MNKWAESPIQLARTQQGEIVLFAGHELWYAFRFGQSNRHLSAEEFHRLHDSVMAFDWKQLPTKFSQSKNDATVYRSLALRLFGELTRSDLLELRELVSRAALLVTTLSRVYNSLN